MLALSVMGFLMALSPAKPQEEVDRALHAGEGLEAIGGFLQWLAQPHTRDVQITAFGTFLKSLTKQLGADKTLEEKAIAYIDKTMGLSKQRVKLREEMKAIAASIDGGVTPEEEAKLRTEMRQLIEDDLKVVKDMYRSTEAQGLVPEEPADTSSDAFIDVLYTIMHEMGVYDFRPYT